MYALTTLLCNNWATLAQLREASGLILDGQVRVGAVEHILGPGFLLCLVYISIQLIRG